MSANGHARRLDRIEATLPPIRPSPEVLEREMDRLIQLYTAREAGESFGVITPKWPHEVLARWMDEIIAEMAAEGST